MPTSTIVALAVARLNLARRVGACKGGTIGLLLHLLIAGVAGEERRKGRNHTHDH